MRHRVQRWVWISVLAASAAALGSCGDDRSGPSAGKHRTTVDFAMTWHDTYDEAFYYVRLEREGRHSSPVGVSGPNIADGSQDGGALVTLGRGPYRLIALARPCKGRCPSSGRGAHLGAPIDRCSMSFDAEGQRLFEVRIVIEPYRGCEIRALRLA